jgi:hypothetical protein
MRGGVEKAETPRRDDVYLFTDMAVMIDGIARKARSPP